MNEYINKKGATKERNRCSFYGMFVSVTPFIDVNKLVRCVDCKHSYESVAGLICSYGECVDCVVCDDFYCKYGERK